LTDRKLAKPEPALTRRLELEVSARLRQEPRPVLTAETELQPKPTFTAKTEVQLPARQSAETGGLLGARTALEYDLRPKAEAVPEYALTPEIKQTLAWAQVARQRLTEIGKLLKTPQGVIQLLRKEPPKEERRSAISVQPISQAEPPQYIKPWTDTPEPFGDVPKYNPPRLTTSTTPTMVDIPSPPTYPPVPTYDAPPIGTPWIPPPRDVPDVPPRETTPPSKPLPPRWWLLLPPSMFIEDAKEGTYRVQEGKKQILLLA